MQSEPLDVVPLWGIFAGTAILVAIAVELGFRIGRYRRLIAAIEPESPVGSIVAAMLGLLAFLLAFTFGLAASRFDDRRLVVLDESNAIGTTYLRAAMLPAPLDEECRALLREYVDVRLAGVEPGKTELAIARSGEIHDKLWSCAVSATKEDRSAVTALFVQSLNEVIDLHSKRIQFGLRSRIPVSIWLALYAVTFLSMGVLGYLEGLASSGRSPATIPLVLTFAAVICLIADLDRPGEGLLRVSQQAMRDLKMSLSESSLKSEGRQP
jgi:hypothetical protein